MVIDFSKLDTESEEYPIITLKNLDGTVIQTLGYAFNLKLKIRYNEASELSFDLPAFVDGNATPSYEDVAGMRIVDIMGIGQFILINPAVKNDGVKEIKTCKAYSLEYEFTYKKLSLPKATYNFWNPAARKDTILGIILERMHSWSVGEVDSSLIGKYRTFEENDVNLYNFIKSTLQKTYNCIFDFDTYSRKINVRDIGSKVNTAPIFLSLDNLIKEIDIEEDTENIFTCLDVNGADGVDIRSVNPMGINKIYDLSYFMTERNFSKAMIAKWESWKNGFKSYQNTYFNISIEKALLTAKLLTEKAALVTLQGALKSYENLQSVNAQAVAQGLNKQAELDRANEGIRQKQQEISAKKSQINAIERDIESITKALVEINDRTTFSAYFTADEIKLLDRYIKEDAIEESSFVEVPVQSYKTQDKNNKISNLTFNISGSQVTKVLQTHFVNKSLYSIRGGSISCSGISLNAHIVRATFERNDDSSFVFTAYFNRGSIYGDSFQSGCISLTGTCHSLSDDTIPDMEIPNVYENGTRLTFGVTQGHLYFTKNRTEFESRSVEWDLLEYGQDILKRMCFPSYSFKVSAANFLALTEFEVFKNKLRFGEKIYLELAEGKILEPIVVGADIDFDKPENFDIHFGDRYNLSDSAFSLVDLLDQSISMGKTVDFSKFNYSAFVDSGASTSVKEFMDSALDVARNAVISSTGQALSWDENGLRLRMRKEGMEDEYEREQIWMINNSIVFSDDSFQTAKMAIGKFEDQNAGSCWGVVAPNIVGTLLAGNNLVIESAKKDRGVSVFRVDGEGAKLHNAVFDVFANNTQITLNPYSGFAIGKSPLYNGSNYAINQNNAQFWVDTAGNVNMKGTLHGVNGSFSGKLEAATGTFKGSLEAATGTFKGSLEAATGRFKGVVQASDFQDLSGRSMMVNSGSSSGYKFNPDYLELKGLSIRNGNTTTLSISSDGSISMRGNITMTGGSISWQNIDERGSDAYRLADDAYDYANTANRNANTAIRTADSAISNVNRLANGQYSGTFIDGRKIISPTIQTNLLVITTPSNNNSKSGLLLEGYYGGRAYSMMEISYFQGTAARVTFRSPASAFANWEFPRTEFYGTLNFRNATIEGLSTGATFA